MTAIPRDPSLDSTLALARDGYTFISKRCRLLGSDVFETRLMLEPAICMTGAAAARLFYDEGRFQRAGAAPPRLLMTLFGKGGVQALDGEAHRRRKGMFLALLDDAAVRAILDTTRREWIRRIPRWEQAGDVLLFHEVEEILCRAVCDRAGVPLPEPDVTRRTADFHAMIDGAGGTGPRHWRGRGARRRAERWIGGLVDAVRAGTLTVPGGSALAVVATYRELDGSPLDMRAAAVELLNLLRPTVAVAWWITFAALALHEHPGVRASIERADDAGIERFAQEVRRFYPFFPFVAARVREDFEWDGFRFTAGRRVLLDIYGTHHNARSWGDPEAFRPERFAEEGDPFRFLPQGAGDAASGHKCPGDPLAVALTKAGAELLVRSMRYRVPEQDLHVDLSRIPTLPRSGFVIRDVHPV
ncbi:MAG: cytochrome P450 [Myxococcota bacterium]